MSMHQFLSCHSTRDACV